MKTKKNDHMKVRKTCQCNTLDDIFFSQKPKQNYNTMINKLQKNNIQDYNENRKQHIFDF